jgi:BirA family transcriptional regulator, biotin operon repressor / biotin---[acetyl-CoA-carboxylase] ligase
MDFPQYVRELDRTRPDHAGPENVLVLETVGSTNLLARAILHEYVNECEEMPPVLLLAWRQTGGRGRLGRSWASPGGRGVYASLGLQLEDPAELQVLPLLVGVGLCRALDPHLPEPCRLKWPNDLLAGGRKIGGILIETLVRPGECTAAVIGFGVNRDLQGEELPDERATSLQLAGGVGVVGIGLAELTWELVAGVERELAHRRDPAYAVESYRAHSVHRPGDRLVCRIGSGTGEQVIEGSFAGFDEQGLLLLDGAGGRQRLSAGEVIGDAKGEC